jgi:hypothetical protein
MVEAMQAAGRAGRDGNPARVTFLIPDYSPGKVPNSWRKPEPSDFGGRGDLIRMLKSGCCIRAALSAHLDGWEGMNCATMMEQLSDEQCHVLPCSRCQIPGVSPVPWTEFPQRAIPVDWSETQCNSWRDWVDTSHLRGPPAEEKIIPLEWGCHPLVPTSAPVNNLTRIRQAQMKRALEGKHITSRILQLFSPACIACLVTHVNHRDAMSHERESCKQWNPVGPRSKLTPSGKGGQIKYSEWKESWARHISNSKVHGVCFSCMLPESNVFHQVSAKNSEKEYECLFPNLVPPLMWSLRHIKDFQQQLRGATDGAVKTLDSFDLFLFTPTNRSVPGICNSTSAIIRYWYSLVNRHQGWPSVDSDSQSLFHFAQ